MHRSPIYSLHALLCTALISLLNNPLKSTSTRSQNITTSKQFIGRFHDSMPCGLVESLQGGAVVCPIEQARQ